MATINVCVSEELRAKAEAQAARIGHTSIEDYLCALLREDLEAGIHSELEHNLLKGLDSPAEEMTEGDWDTMRNDLLCRHGKDRI